ncbi:hypothetical protein BDA96_04G287400 [Sorghum bicolor]|uniref:Uncharacterized protein n=1 Tax=Sorghum bicolor TaxID=4558 RepID=A0A921R5U0_SORBI|nr:hypothetical protein BDA96_04G287400 [Sorghum bicolor]
MEGWKGTKGYRQIIRDEQPNTGRVHQMEPDGPLHHPVGATNHPLYIHKASVSPFNFTLLCHCRQDAYENRDILFILALGPAQDACVEIEVLRCFFSPSLLLLD